MSQLGFQKNMSKKIDVGKNSFSEFLLKPQRAPKGMLHYYILHAVSEAPTSSYEISESIEEKTEGIWRPSDISIHASVKELAKRGLIQVNSKSRASEESHRVYEITRKGMKLLRNRKDLLAVAGRRSCGFSAILIDVMEPARIPTFMIEGWKGNFQISRNFIQSKLSKLGRGDAEFALKEYALNLERQKRWARAKLRILDEKGLQRGHMEVHAPKVGLG
jgi:DNA-binding PadR family transcriptional regulator